MNSGCTILDPRTSSYGAAFAANGGGVYATEFSKNGVSVWFFPRANVPSDLSSNSSAPDPSGWGEPAARYGGSSCDIPTFFAPQHLVIDITACGVSRARLLRSPSDLGLIKAVTAGS